MKAFRVPLSAKQRRRGFTLIELLVVISIIAVLMSLILPGVNAAREAGRRTQCFNNLKNQSLACLNYASNRNQLPPLVGGIDLTGPSVGPVPYNSGGAVGAGVAAMPASWMVHILPYMEQETLYQRLTAPSRAENLEGLLSTRVAGFNCPNDQTSDELGAAGYVANAGYITKTLWDNIDSQAHRLHSYDWQLDGTGAPTSLDVQVTIATGAMFRDNSPWYDINTAGSARLNDSGLTMNLTRFRDGTSQTILLAENLDTRNFTTNVAGVGGFGGIGTGDIAFAVRIEEQAAGTPPGTPAVPADNGSSTGGVGLTGSVATPQRQYALATPNGFILSGTTPLDLGASKINARLNLATPGQAPRPSSLHPQIVCCAFADGSVRSIGQGIADSVYLRLVSSAGGQYGQGVLSSTDY